MTSSCRNTATRAMPENNLYCGGNCRPLATPESSIRSGSASQCGLCPLAFFCTWMGRALPEIEEVTSLDIPQPYRYLLVHTKDMTSTLERFYQARTQLQLLNSATNNGVYQREVLLTLDPTNAPVEFGAIAIQLPLFPPEAAEAVVDARQPLGAILQEHGMPFVSRPKAFIRVLPDEAISGVLGLEQPAEMYGRCNALYDPTGRTLADIVEILPPVVNRETVHGN